MSEAFLPCEHVDFADAVMPSESAALSEAVMPCEHADFADDGMPYVLPSENANFPYAVMPYEQAAVINVIPSTGQVDVTGVEALTQTEVCYTTRPLRLKRCL